MKRSENERTQAKCLVGSFYPTIRAISSISPNFLLNTDTMESLPRSASFNCEHMSDIETETDTEHSSCMFEVRKLFISGQFFRISRGLMGDFGIFAVFL